MRVAYITASISRQAGGLKDSVRNEAMILRARGLDVSVHAVEDSDTASDLTDWDPLKVTLSRGQGPARFSYSSALASHIAKSMPDVLSSHGLWRYTSLVTRRWHAQTGKPYVVSPHGMLDPWALNNSRLRKTVAAWLFENNHLRAASCIRALCGAERDAIRQFGLKNPIAVIPNGVNPPPADVPSSISPSTHVSGFSGAKVALSLGRLHPKKNLMALLEAWRLFLDSGSEGAKTWRLVVAGWNEESHEADLKRRAADLGLINYVWFAGPLFGLEKDAAYRSARAFVAPSLSEGLPIVVLEAWSYGLPVAMTRECNLPEGFRAGAAVEIGTDAKSICAGLSTLCSMNDNEADAMGRRGRSLIAEKFSWDMIGQGTESVLRWIAGQGPRPDCVEG